jgi:hypothetical protein
MRVPASAPRLALVIGKAGYLNLPMAKARGF